MQTFTTKGYMALPDEDEQRSNGCRDAYVLENESGSIQLEMTVQELEESGFEVDSDVIEDEVMEGLIEHLNTEGLLESPVQ